MNRRVVEGREAELSAAFGLPMDSFPLQLLTDSRRIEDRAIATISGDTQGNAQSILAQIFPGSAAAFLGITAETVPAGQALYPVLSTGATVESPDKGAATTESTGAITVKTLVPSRLSAALRYTIEDAALLSGMDASFQDNLRDALGSDLDGKVVAKLNSTAVAADPSAPGAQTEGYGLPFRPLLKGRRNSGSDCP